MDITIRVGKKQAIIFIGTIVVLAVLWVFMPKFTAHVGASKKEKAATVADNKDQKVSRITDPVGAEAEKIKDLSKKEGAAAAYAYVKKTYGANPGPAHDYAHIVGRVAYEQDGIKALAVCDADFGFGCYHGLFDALVRKEGAAGMASSQTGCEDLRLPGPVASCIHGVGHGVMGYQGKVDPAIQMCKTLSMQNQIYCYDGVYMELFNSAMKGEMEKPPVNSEQPWKYCMERAVDSLSQCIRNLTIYLLASGTQTPATVAGWCDKLATEAKPHCVVNFGVHAAQMANGSPDKVAELCGNFKTMADKDMCVINAGREFIFQSRSAESANAVCGKASAAGKQSCLTELQNMRDMYGKK